MTLGELISTLQNLPQTDKISDYRHAYSYRGYYDQLAIRRKEYAVCTVAELVTYLKGCIGKSYEGYKGGWYEMDKRTPVWIAEYGELGSLVAGVKPLFLGHYLITEEELEEENTWDDRAAARNAIDDYLSERELSLDSDVLDQIVLLAQKFKA